jgi:chromatin remodeling complex protein RSC6
LRKILVQKTSKNIKRNRSRERKERENKIKISMQMKEIIMAKNGTRKN